MENEINFTESVERIFRHAPPMIRLAYAPFVENALRAAYRAGQEAMMRRAAKICRDHEPYAECKDPGHDSRWCGECEARTTEAEHLERTISALPPEEWK